jgi:hypothetical protein
MQLMDAEKGLNNTELWKMLIEVENLDDDILVEEILHIKYEYSELTRKIVSNFMKTGKLNKKNRESLVAHYVLHWLEEKND